MGPRCRRATMSRSRSPCRGAATTRSREPVPACRDEQEQGAGSARTHGPRAPRHGSHSGGAFSICTLICASNRQFVLSFVLPIDDICFDLCGPFFSPCFLLDVTRFLPMLLFSPARPRRRASARRISLVRRRNSGGGRVRPCSRWEADPSAPSSAPNGGAAASGSPPLLRTAAEETGSCAAAVRGLRRGLHLQRRASQPDLTLLKVPGWCC